MMFGYVKVERVTNRYMLRKICKKIERLGSYFIEAGSFAFGSTDRVTAVKDVCTISDIERPICSFLKFSTSITNYGI